MGYHFEEFTGKGVRFAGYFVSFSKLGNFGFSFEFCHKHELRKYDAVIFHYDKESNSVGFEFVHDENYSGKGYRLAKSDISGGVSARSDLFLKACKIQKPDEAKRYEPKEVTYNRKKIYVINLDGPVEE